MSSAPTTLDAALAFSDLGYSVFPCVPGKKKPLTTHGLLDATTNAEQVERWWAEAPEANVAIRTDGLVIVDVDGAGDAWLGDLDERWHSLAIAPSSQTPRGGRHYYFRQPAGKAWRNTQNRLADRVDTRADGGYVLAPPSITADGQYGWCHGSALDVPPEKLPVPPDWLVRELDLIGTTLALRKNEASTANEGSDSETPADNGPSIDMEARVARCRAYLEKCPDAISGHGGHDATLRAACECFRFGLDEETAWRVLRWFNDTKTGDERWTDAELAHKLGSARGKVESQGEFGIRLTKTDEDGSEANPVHIASLRTDVGNAARLVKCFGRRLRFCHGPDQWLIWDMRRWKPDGRGLIVKMCKKTALAILDEAKRADDDEKARLATWAITSQRQDRLTAMARLAQPEVAVGPDDLDADPLAFNCLNGTIDLRTGELQPHRAEDLITKLAPVEFDRDASSPRFNRFLREVFDGDEDLIRFVQRFLGMSLTSDVREQILPIFYGQGNNGKNVLLDTISAIVGDYACEAPPGLLTVSKHSEHPTEIADLCGRRLVIASESEESATLRLQLVKRLTGNARLKARFMRQDFFEFKRTHKLILVTNNRPVVRENTEAAWRRLKLVPFNVVIPPEERDPFLLENLKCEWPGILAWLVRGCLAWQRQGLGEPTAVVEATSSYRADQDVLGEFLAELCVVQAQAWVSRASIFDAYQEWSQRAKERAPLDRAALFDRLRRLEGVSDGYGQEHGKRARGFRGLGLQVADSTSQQGAD